MSSLIQYGIVSEVKPGYARVKFEELDGIVSDWLPVLVRKSKSEKESWQLEINEHVVCAMDKHLEDGVVLGAIPNEEDTPDPGEEKGKCRILFSDGTLFEYDINSHKMTVDVKGELEATTTGDCTIKSGAKLKAIAGTEASVDAGTELKGTAAVKASIAAPLIELTGNVVISGTVTAGGLMIAPGGTMGMQDGTPLKATGDIQTTGEIKGADVKAGAVSLLTHTHTSGAAGSPTSPPLP